MSRPCAPVMRAKLVSEPPARVAACSPRYIPTSLEISAVFSGYAGVCVYMRRKNHFPFWVYITCMAGQSTSIYGVFAFVSSSLWLWVRVASTLHRLCRLQFTISPHESPLHLPFNSISLYFPHGGRYQMPFPNENSACAFVARGPKKKTKDFFSR